ncbi:hypothetical protein [Paenibacillus sp. SN-8-1]|uniref:hypothetical protein n=1 Tax=Paenibacillus sp. SN-8-1 TaxID=3435409 RepID=UPI003D9A7E58
MSRSLRLPDHPFDRCCPRIPLIEMDAAGIRGQRRTLRFYGTIPGSSAASCGLLGSIALVGSGGLLLPSGLGSSGGSLCAAGL